MLIAIAAPWLLMFALLGQMHERYLMWGAVVSAVALGVSVRLSIIHFILSAASTAMIVHVMLTDKKLEATLPTIDVLKHIRPYGSIVVLDLRRCLPVGDDFHTHSGFPTWRGQIGRNTFPLARTGAGGSLTLRALVICEEVSR